MKIDTHQTSFESIQISPDEDWYESNSYESIQPKSESFYDTIQYNLNRFNVMLVMKLWIDSNISRKDFDTQKWSFYIHENTQDIKGSHDTMSFYDTIQYNLNRFNVMLVMKLWIDSNISRKDFDTQKWSFLYTTNTQDIKGSHDIMSFYDTIQYNLNRFTVMLVMKLWIDSNISRKDFHTQKWSFIYTTTHKTSMDHMTQWEMVY